MRGDGRNCRCTKHAWKRTSMPNETRLTFEETENPRVDRRVELVELTLRDCGHYTHAIDGRFGPRMTTAVRKLQITSGLEDWRCRCVDRKGTSSAVGTALLRGRSQSHSETRATSAKSTVFDNLYRTANGLRGSSAIRFDCVLLAVPDHIKTGG